MMKYIQFYSLSTGYVDGTIPPQYDPTNVKPIEHCGSDGVEILDGRWSYANCKRWADSAMTSPKRHRMVGYRIMQGRSFSDARPMGPYVQRQGA